MMPAMMVVSKSHKRNSHPDAQRYQQGDQNRHQRRVQILEQNKPFAFDVMIGKSLIALPEPNGRQAQSNQGARRDNGPTESSHGWLLWKKNGVAVLLPEHAQAAAAYQENTGQDDEKTTASA